MRTIRTLVAICVIAAMAAAVTPLNGRAAPSITSQVYSDSLINGWQNWSWGGSVTEQDPAYVRTGSYSMSEAYTAAWGGLYMGNNTPFNTAGYDNLVFYINGGAASGQSMTINLTDAAGTFLPEQNLNLYIAGGGVAANTWRLVTVPLAALQGANTTISGIVIADALGGSQPRYYIDDMQFATDLNATPTFTPTATRTSTRTATGTPPTATRTSTAMPTVTPANGLPPIPNGVAGYYTMGLFNADTSSLPSPAIPLDYRYQYLAGGANTGDGWATWNPGGGYATSYINSTRALGLTPSFIYYQLLQSAPNYDEYSNFQNASTMHSYYDDFRLLMQKCALTSNPPPPPGSPSIVVNIEPDLTGVMQQHSSNTGDDASRQPVKVGSSGQGDVAGIPDTFRGFYQALAHIRDLYAPSVLLSIDVSSWGASDDISLVSDPLYDWRNHATRTARYINSLGPGYQLLTWNPSDRDAGYYQVVQGSNHWWDQTNTTLPNFNRMEEWMGQIVTQTGKRVLMWQVPNGNGVYRTENNTDGHWQDNRAEYFLNPLTGRGHIGEWANAGFLGMMFGAGVGSQTHYFDYKADGVTNPPAINGNTQSAIYSDDDGGYLRLGLSSYYSQGTLPLPGGGPQPTATPTQPAPAASATRPPSTATASPTRPAPGATASPTQPRPSNTPARTATAIATATTEATNTAIATATRTRTPLSTQTPGGPTATPTTCAVSFSDVQPADYYYAAVNYLYCHSAISGYSDGTFRPLNNTTRSQLSKIIVLAEGFPLNTAGGPHFTDVPASNAFYPYVETAYNRGLISGYADGTFRSGANVTRGQLSKVVVQAEGWRLNTVGGPHFADVPPSNPFYAYIETAFNHGVVSGYTDGTFRAGSSATRGQISKIIYSAITAP